MNNIEKYGKFPVEDAVLRRDREILVVAERERLKLLHGNKTNVLCQVAVSNDRIHEGIVTIPAGAHSDEDHFDADSMLIPLNGVVSFTIESRESGPRPVSRERFEVKPNEKLFLPAQTCFRMHNFSSEKVDVLFIAAAGCRAATKA